MKNLLLIVAAAASMSLGWLGVSGLPMLVALVPLLIVARRTRKFAPMAGFTALFVALWCGSTTWWVWNATPVGPIAIVAFSCVFTGIPFLAWWWIDKRAPRALSYTVLVAGWLVGEWIFNVNQASFPWLAVGSGLARDVWAVQWMEFTGEYGGTLWVLVSNILMFETIKNEKLKIKNFFPPAVAIFAPIIASLVIYTTYKEPSATAKVAVVQPNVDAWNGERDDEKLAQLVATADRQADFVVLPESAVEGFLDETALATAPGLMALRAAAPPEASLVAGATTYRTYGAAKPTRTARGDARTGFYDVFNSAVAVAPTGEITVYHKAKMVPGAEMMPTWWWIQGIQKLFRNLDFYAGQYGFGGARTTFSNGRTTAGVGICYESIYGEYFSGFAGNGAELLLVITNDGWWGHTPGYRQHFDFARLRAIETRRSIARSANTGRSGFITPRGDVVRSLGWDERGVIAADLPLSDRQTLYTRAGDYICRVALLVWALSVLYFIARKLRIKN